ncbi:MAG: hypothetical protein ACPLKQ_08430 [Candidatus Bathyarchaeales archaeon]
MISTSALASIIPFFLAVLTFIIIMLLPAFIELKKPKDAGPRIMLEEAASLHFLNASLDIPLLDEEDKVELSQKTMEKVAAVLAVLPRLEA